MPSFSISDTRAAVGTPDSQTASALPPDTHRLFQLDPWSAADSAGSLWKTEFDFRCDWNISLLQVDILCGEMKAEVCFLIYLTSQLREML
jgi:hypothetical protein